jgi:hypothetical protein
MKKYFDEMKTTNRSKAPPKDGRLPGPEIGRYEELIRAKQAALRLYRNYSNVVGISAGTKYVQKTATGDHASIHFYVRKKGSPKNDRKNVLPRFVYGRFKNGRVNRKLRFTTDVIEVGRVRMVCGAGSRIASNIGLTRQNGTMAFVFKNKLKPGSNYYVVSCAHVIGNIDGQSDIPVIVESECRPGTTPFATTIFSSAQHDQQVEYDIAIAQIDSACLPMRDLEIVETNVSIRSFMPKSKIIPSLPVSCALPVSDAKRGVVGSHASSVNVEYRKSTYEVENAWMVKVDHRVREGDSGGIIYDGGAAIGIVFAASDSDDGWAWFHPLVDAFEYVRKNVNVELKCF